MLAHGIGERGELPLPTWLFAWAMVLALVLSFLAAGTMWTQPRLARAARGRPLVSYRALEVLHGLARLVAFVVYVVCVAAAFVGFDAPDRNLLPVTLYVTVWVGGQVLGGLVGDVWGAINPIATLAGLAEGLARRLGRAPGGGPTGLGHWPAAAGLVVFLFYELSHPRGAAPRALAWVVGLHALVTIVTGFLWGARWVVEHEPFTVLFAKLGAIGPLFARRDESSSALGLRPPMSGLATMEVRSGTTMLLLVTIGGTSFDGFSESEPGRELLAGNFGWQLAWAELGLMVMSITAVAMLYLLGVWWVTRVTELPFERSWVEFTPSLVPIAFGYAVAHYVELFVNESQSFVFRLSDPFGQGWDLFGGSDGLVWRIDPDIVAWVQVASILIGHVGAVVVAHDRSVELFPAGRALYSQFAMLFVMVGYSAIGLWLLLSV